MNYAFFPGCKIPYFLEPYGRSSRAVLQHLGVGLVELEFNCCGYPVRHLSHDAFILSASRNLAIAGELGLDILTPCKCCFGTLKSAEHRLLSDDRLRLEANRGLKQEGLAWRGTNTVKHLLTALAQDLGLEAIKSRIMRHYHGLAVAAHYGCHALRPGRITQFDNPLAPTIFEKLISITGAETVSWPRRLECCGAPLSGKNDVVSLNLMRTKLLDARDAGAACVCTACTYCQIQFEQGPGDSQISPALPSILYPQLLGRALGMTPESLGMERHLGWIDDFLGG